MKREGPTTGVWPERLLRAIAAVSLVFASVAFISSPTGAASDQFTFVPDHRVAVQVTVPNKLTAQQWSDTLPQEAPTASLTFEANVGQAQDDLDFIANGLGYVAVLQDGEAELRIDGSDSGQAVRMGLVGANVAPTEVRQGRTVNIGPTDGPEYASVEYTDIYPGVDILYSAVGSELEYSFVIAPGSDPGSIQLEFDGVNEATIAPNGDLLLATADGLDFVSTAPLTYQIVNGERQVVDSGYAIAGDGTVGFRIGTFDTNLPLVIDPTFRSAAIGSSGGGTTIAMARPAGLVQNDVMIASIAQPNVGPVTPPAGWTFLRRDVQAGTVSQDLYYKVATASEPTSFVWTLGIASESAGAISAFSGVDTSNPINAHGGQGGTASTSYVAPSITTTVNNATLVGFFASTAGGPTAPPTGMTERADQGSGAAATEIAEELLGTAGSTGTRTATGATSDHVAQLVALTPEPPSDLRGFWRFEEPSGTVATDSSSYGNDGTYDAPANRSTGVVSTGLDLTGSDDWVIVPDPVDGSLDFGSGDFTISLWVKTTQVPASGAYPEIVYKRTSGGSSTGFEMYLIENEANRLAFDIHQNGSQILTRGTPIDDGLWHHVAAVRGSSVVLYIDGVEVDSTVDTFGDISNPSDLIFGRDPAAIAWSEFDGILDEVKIYGRALSPVEISVLATAPLLVNSTGDSSDNNAGDGACDTGGTVGAEPECTLRAAIEEANFAGDINDIGFAIPTGDAGYTASPLAFTIAPSSLLPAISTPMTIDGSTQSQYSTEGRPVIELDGTNVSAGEENGLYLTGGDATIRGLVINNWGDDAIDIEFNGGNTIVGNYIGTNVTGTVAEPNAWGINFKTGANIIGGTALADRNVVSGNTNDGLYLYKDAATGNVVQGNYVGTNAAGTAAVANGRYGLYIWSGANGNMIGGATSAHGNVISGNGAGEGGILIDGGATSGNTVRHNVIGTSAAGDAAIPNNLHGLSIDGAPNTQVLDNIISGNDGHGIYLSNSNNNTIQANSIGTNAGGSINLGNALTGIYTDAFGSSNNLIGGAVAGEGNTIAFNGEGITFLSGNDNAIIGNDIYTNDSLGIDFDNDGVTANSNADTWLNYPVTTSATASGIIVTMAGTYDVPAGNYRFEYFKNPLGADPTGFGEGQQFVASSTLSHTGGGSEGWGAAFVGAVGDIITVTITEDLGGGNYGATSEFSATVTVTPAAVSNQPPTLDPVGTQSVDETALLAFTATASDPDLPTDTLTFTLEDGTDTVPTGAGITTGGDFTWTPTESQGGGSYSFKIRVTDDGTGTLFDEEEILFTVNDTNQAPVLAPISDQSTAEGATIAFTATASDADLPADTLTFSVTGLPTGASFNTTTGTFAWTPTEAQGPGSFPITITVTDNGTPNLSDSTSFTITVTEINTAPVLASIASVNTDPLSAIDFTATASDSDAPANVLTFSATGLPPGASLDASTGVFSWTPGTGDASSTHAITVTVSDGGGMTDSQGFTIVVNGVTTTTTTPATTTTTTPATTTTTPATTTTTPATTTTTTTTTSPSGNRPPVVALVSAQSIAEHQQISYRLAASDPDGDTITFELVNAPSGLRIGRTTGIITWTPTESQGPRRHDFSVTVTDGFSSDLTVPISIDVLEVNEAPTLASPTKQIVAVGSPFTYGLAAADSDIPNNTLRYSVIDGPVGLTVEPETGMISWIPQTFDGGQTVTVKVRVDDNGTPARGTTTSFDLEVSPDSLPFAQLIVRGDTFTTSYGQGMLLDVLANDVGRDLKIESVTQPDSGTATIMGGGIWFEPAGGFAGVTFIEYVVVGSDGSTGAASVTIEVASPRLDDVDNSIHIDLWDYTPAASVAEPLTFSGVGSAMIDALGALRIPTSLLILSGAWVFVFSLAITRITRQWKFAAISKVPRGESVEVLSWASNRTRFRFRHDADLLWVSSRRVRRNGSWYRRVETPRGKGLILDDHVDDMIDAYLDAGI